MKRHQGGNEQGPTATSERERNDVAPWSGGSIIAAVVNALAWPAAGVDLDVAIGH